MASDDATTAKTLELFQSNSVKYSYPAKVYRKNYDIGMLIEIPVFISSQSCIFSHEVWARFFLDPVGYTVDTHKLKHLLFPKRFKIHGS